MEAMHFRRWIDIEACLKQNEFWTEKKRTDEVYDPTQKYHLVWDVMTHNMNQRIGNIRNPVLVDRNHSFGAMNWCKWFLMAKPFIPVIKNY